MLFVRLTIPVKYLQPFAAMVYDSVFIFAWALHNYLIRVSTYWFSDQELLYDLGF